MFPYLNVLPIDKSSNILYFQEADVGNTTAGSVAAIMDVIGYNTEPKSEVQAASQQNTTAPDHGYMRIQ